MKKVGLLLVLFLSFKAGIAQYVFETNAGGGNWTAAGTWTCRTDIIDCTGAPSVPGALDIALISSNSATAITLNAASISIGDIYVMSDVAANKISKSPLTSCNLTINGQLVGILPDLSSLAEPANAVFVNQGNLTLTFNGTNGLDPVITSWGHNAPLPRTAFNPTAGTMSLESFSVRQLSTVVAGTVQIASGHELRDFTGSSALTINSGATLLVDGSIGRGTDPTLATNRFGSITINGSLNTAATSYVNAATVNIGATGVLNVGFSGSNQTQGWWYQSNSPSTSSLNATSTVNYSANTVQNVAAGVTYGNLTLTSSSAAVKTLSGSGLIITGNLTVGANVTSSPASQVEFTGTIAQTISGAGTLNFNGGLEVNKSAGTLTVNKAITITGGLTLTAGTLAMAGTSTISGGVAINAGTWNLGDVSTTLASGSFSNAGTVTSGTSGTLTVSGNSTFSGIGSTTFNNLTISGTGVATINNSAWSITGNILNNGTITLPSSSTVTFTGGSAQSISGNALSLGNLTINKSSSILSNNANVELRGVLTVTTGTFDADGTGGIFTLNSDTNATARIGPMAGGSILGEVTFERYFNNTSNRWRNLSFPVSSVTYAELGSSLTLNTNSLATYTESTLGNADQGWVTVSGGTLNSAKGHSAWMYNIAPITISVTGPMLQNVPALGGSPYNFGVTYTDDAGQPATQDGWNFVPNPFASPIDWNNSGWVKTNVNGAAAVWDVESNVYRYTNVDWDGVVAQGQAFWVQTNAASPVLTCTESAKEAVTDPVFYRVASEDSKLLISLKSELFTDKAAIRFRDDASFEFDSNYDSYKLKNPIFNLSSLTNGGEALAANALPKGGCNSINLNVADVTPGSYSLSFEGLQSFSNLNSVTLVDHFTSQSQIIEEGAQYTFAVTSDESSFGSERFQLIFNFTDAKQAPEIVKAGRELVSNYDEGNQWYLNEMPIEGATSKYLTPSVRGAYSVAVQEGVCNLKSTDIMITEGLGRVFPNPASEVLKVDVQNILAPGTSGDILIHSVSGQLMINEKFTDQDAVKTIGINGIKSGLYIVTIVSGNGIIHERSKVVVK